MNPVNDSNASGSDSKTEDASSTAQGANKRRFARFDWRTQIPVLWLEAHGRGTCVAMRTEDLSAGGIALLSSSWIHPGRCAAVLLVNRRGHRSIRWVEVLHGRYVSERKAHVIGCKWIPAPENAPPIRIVESAAGPQLEFDTDLSD